MPRILIIKLSSLGDLVHALPTVHAIRTGWGTQVDWVTQPEYMELVSCFDDVDRVLTFPRRSFAKDFRAYRRALRETEYDCVIDLQGLLKSALLVGRLARAKRRIGPSFSREGVRRLYDEAPAPGAVDRHAVEEVMDVLPLLGLRAAEPVFPMTVPVADLHEPGPRVAFVPRSRWPAKDWPIANFVRVGRSLQEEKGATIYVIGGPDDHDACRRLADGLADRVVNSCGSTTLVEMAGLLHAMDLVVSVDSGPMHVAAAGGVPVLALFGVTDPRRTGPYGPAHRVLMAPEFRENPDLSRTFKKPDTAGGWTIRPEEVTEAAFQMLH